MYIFKKQPSENVDYAIVMSDWFSVYDDDDFIIRLEAVSVPAFDEVGSLALGPDYVDSDQVTQTLPDYTIMADKSGLDRIGKVWVGGGTSGQTYKVTVTITTDLGRKEEVDFKIKVKDA
jgi:hypothetical protein